MNLVKENLRYYLPAIVEFLGKHDFPWTKVNTDFNKKIEKRLEEASGETFTVEASIYDIIIACKKGLKVFISTEKYTTISFQKYTILN